ncbi:glycosyltransferase [Legionella beliardensis]|uniref:Glycosyltransferase n=1 Tax=Legionella beliardensis TaxID=91822 RepID=A0A378I0L9_9GAMM|nr:glycosyltransferase [Legionella beliardensis]STX28738.1 glycosyltransferase [Legionella beliardensis]
MSSTAKQKLKIIIVAETYPPEINGAARFGQRLAEGLCQLGHDVYVIAPASEKGKSFSTSNHGVTEYRLRSHPILTHSTFRMCFPWQIKKEVKKIFDQVQPDVVHIQCHFTIGRLAIKESNRRQIPIIATVHVVPENIIPYLPLPNWLINLLIRYLFYDMRNVLSKVQTITMPTDLAAKSVSKELNLPIITISNGINSEHYQLKPNEYIDKNNKFIVLFVGRIAEEKHIDILIKAIAKSPSHLNIYLEIVGDGEICDKLKNLAKSLNIADKVAFLGVISEEDLRKAYLRASLFCMPSTAELQSLATLEAMSASLPVILADALALPHLVIEGKNGYLFQPGNSSELAEKIEIIKNLSEALRLKMGQASFEMAAQHDIKNTLARYEALYKGL